MDSSRDSDRRRQELFRSRPPRDLSKSPEQNRHGSSSSNEYDSMGTRATNQNQKNERPRNPPRRFTNYSILKRRHLKSFSWRDPSGFQLTVTHQRTPAPEFGVEKILRATAGHNYRASNVGHKATRRAAHLLRGTFVYNRAKIQPAHGVLREDRRNYHL